MINTCEQPEIGLHGCESPTMQKISDRIESIRRDRERSYQDERFWNHEQETRTAIQILAEEVDSLRRQVEALTPSENEEDE